MGELQNTLAIVSSMVCPRCQSEVSVLTKDHIVPRWFASRVASLGIGMRDYNGKKTEMVCQKCNGDKGGAIVWSDEYVRNYMHEFASRILEKLKDTA